MLSKNNTGVYKSGSRKLDINGGVTDNPEEGKKKNFRKKKKG